MFRIEKASLYFRVNTGSHRGFRQFLDEMSMIEPLTVDKFSIDGKTFSIMNVYKRPHVKEVLAYEDSPVLLWAAANRKRIRKRI